MRRVRWGGRRHAVGVSLGGLLAGVLLAPAPAAARSVQDPLPPTNLAVLQSTLGAAARDLVAAAPLETGGRIAVRLTGERQVDRETVQALLAALVDRGVEAWPVAAATPGSAAEAPTAAPAAAAESVAAGIDLAALNKMQNPKAAARAGANSASAGDALSGLPSSLDLQQLPVLEVTVDEARVEYTHLHRAGVLGAQHVERRALSRLSGRLLRPQTRTVYWVGASDSSYADVVPRSQLKALEDAGRPELRGTIPVQGWTKAAEPLLVGALVIGLVALFYTNRP